MNWPLKTGDATSAAERIGTAKASVRREPLSRKELEDVYEQYGHLMKRRCAAILRNESAADDAFQEAFVNLMRYGSGFREADAKLRWLYRVCDRSCFRQFDRAKKHREREAPLEHPVAAPPGVDHEARDRVIKVLDQLDDKTRAVAVMAHLDGMSKVAIGEELGWSRQTIHKKLLVIEEAARKVAARENQDV
ncbi:MAG: sigma-70 family RNA polymerase sigma factor [Myxococcota bacterium]